MSRQHEVPSMDGKTVVVTGATAGIGRETARALARAGARTFVVGRNPDKLAATIDSLAKDAPRDRLEPLLCDFESQASIRTAANELRSRTERLDVLINNAGAYFSERAETEDGLERTFALNHVGYFLFTKLLLDLLDRSAPARVVNVASEAHRNGHLVLDDLQSTRGFDSLSVYGTSKLCNILFTRELARRVDSRRITVNALHPGVIASEFSMNANGYVKWFFFAARPFLLSPEAGARTTIYLASSPDVANVTGEYFSRRRVKRPSAQARDEALARGLWERTEALVRA